MTGSKTERKELNEALAYVRKGGHVHCMETGSSRTRSLTHFIELLKGLQERGIAFISLTEQIDTATPGGKLIFHLMGALAEFERNLIRERTNAGLAAAKARGRVGGRPRKRQRPAGKSRWLGACSLTGVTPSQKPVLLLGSPARRCIAT